MAKYSNREELGDRRTWKERGEGVMMTQKVVRDRVTGTSESRQLQASSDLQIWCHQGQKRLAQPHSRSWLHLEPQQSSLYNLEKTLSKFFPVLTHPPATGLSPRTAPIPLPKLISICSVGLLLPAPSHKPSCPQLRLQGFQPAVSTPSSLSQRPSHLPVFQFALSKIICTRTG